MSSSYWTSPEDFDADMWVVSDFCDTPYERDKHKPSPHTKKARSKPNISIYDDPLDQEDEENTVRLGRRGRGYTLGNDYNFKLPGGIPSSFLQQQYQTTQDIREVCGLGFSNDIIENSLKGDREEHNHTTEPKHWMPDIRLTSSPASESSSSKYSTPSASPLPTSSKEQSPARSPKSKHEPKVVVDIKAAQRSVYSQPEVAKTTKAPPIYDILKPAKSKLTKISKPYNLNGDFCKPEKSEVNNWENLFIPSQKKMYDIKSTSDFPELC